VNVWIASDNEQDGAAPWRVRAVAPLGDATIPPRPAVHPLIHKKGNTATVNKKIPESKILLV